MISQNDIINSAVIRLGNSAVLSADIQSKIEQSYNFGMQLLLSSNSWNFKQNIAQLLEDTDTSNKTNYKYKFILPANFQSMVGVFDNKVDKALQQYQYQLINDNIYINCKNTVIQYVINNVDGANMPAYFADYLCNWLCVEFINVIGNKATLNLHLKNLDDSKSKAIAIDSKNNGLKTYAYMSDSYLARFNSGND